MKWIMMMALFFSFNIKAWRSTSVDKEYKNCIEYNVYRNDYPITPIKSITPITPIAAIPQTIAQMAQITETSKAERPTSTIILQPTPFKFVKTEKLKRFLLKRGLDWMVKAMP